MKNFYPRLVVLCAISFLHTLSASGQEKKAVKDPVCGVNVNTGESFDWKYAGKTYYFHAYSCMRAFKMNPQHFLTASCVSSMIVQDPVCGMKVNKSESYDTKYKGQTYYFDSYECRETFLLNPEKFLKMKCDTTLR